MLKGLEKSKKASGESSFLGIVSAVETKLESETVVPVSVVPVSESPGVITTRFNGG